MGLLSAKQMCYPSRMADDDLPTYLPTHFHAEDGVATEVDDWYDPTRLEKVRRKPARSANAIHDTFDLIGGVPRLATWANENQGEFFTKLFSKTIERAGKVEHSGEIKIISAVPRTTLDGTVEDGDFVEIPKSDDE